MIIVRAPMRISFVGGGTDLPDFYRHYPGRVISTAIDKYVYIAINGTPLVQKISARYSISETVDHPKELNHTRIKAALLDLRIGKGIEIASFAPLPAKTGLGSSSTFSVALLKGLYAFKGKNITTRDVAEAACRLEIELLKEPIGKQDQYVAAFGGFNVMQFNKNGSVDVKPVLLDYKKRLGLESHLTLFFTGITRSASSVLGEQKKNIKSTFETLKIMSDSVYGFEEALLQGDFHRLGRILHDGWMMKKNLASGVTNNVLDAFYDAGIHAGAWGGKVLGAGGGGCVMFLSPEEEKEKIRRAIKKVARLNNLDECTEIPVKFVQSGAELILNHDRVSL